MTCNNRNVTGFIAAKNNQSPPKMTDMHYANSEKKSKKKQTRMRQEKRSMGESLRVEAAAVERERITQREVNHERTAKTITIE